MGLLFLILFLISEIALTVLTFTKWYEKAKILRNRTIVAAAEFLILLLIVVIPTTYMKWRFACALVMLLVRFVFAGIRFLLKGKKVQGNVNKPARIICCVFTVMFLGISLVPSFIFSNYNGLEVTGEYEIGECSAILIDSRIEEFENDGSKREVPVHFYYPEAEGEFPLVVFSHGAFGYYQSNYSTYAELASNGYVVVALDHPYHAFFTKDSQGKTIIVDMEFMTDAVDISNGNMSESEAMELSREFETRQKLYELEAALKEKRFLRISKSTLVNLMKIKAIKPALNGRFTALLYSGEETVISRKYVPELKKALKGEG